jgi:DNA adenine methylase
MILKIAKPFLKWAGGKTQLLPEIERSLPKEITSKKFTYVEPFVGGGAVLFWIMENFPNVENAIINDINADLTNTYKIIASQPQVLIEVLEKFEKKFHLFENDLIKRKAYYMEQRALFNTRSNDKVTQAALVIFLNKTCFNGLFRVNKSNGFNVPMGDSTKQKICDNENIMAVSKVLQRVEILTGDYRDTLKYAEQPALFYFDPPYKPLSNTSSFNTYTKDDFGDTEQIELRDFCNTLDSLNHYWMLSNSDVKGKDITDTFFDDIYKDFNINRVYARRSINADGAKRGKLTELLITNYDYEQALQPA